MRLGDANLADADFRESRLVGVEFTGTEMNGAQFAGATLDGCRMRDVDLDGADFTGAVLTRTRLAAKTCDGVRLEKTAISNCVLSDIDASDVNFREAKLQNVRLQLRGLGVRFDLAELAEVNLSGSVLQGASFRDTHLAEVDFGDPEFFGDLESDFGAVKLDMYTFNSLIRDAVMEPLDREALQVGRDAYVHWL